MFCRNILEYFFSSFACSLFHYISIFSSVNSIITLTHLSFQVLLLLQHMLFSLFFSLFFFAQARLVTELQQTRNPADWFTQLTQMTRVACWTTSYTECIGIVKPNKHSSEHRNIKLISIRMNSNWSKYECVVCMWVCLRVSWETINMIENWL